MSALSLYCIDLVRTVKISDAGLIVGRHEEMDRMVQILCRQTKNNPLLLGPAGVGKTVLVEALAREIAGLGSGYGETQTLPAALPRRVYSLQVAAVVGDTKLQGEFEKRVNALLEELQTSAQRGQPAILFIDEIHTLLTMRLSSTSFMDLLKPALARGELRCIGATTDREYQAHFQKDPAFARRFCPVHVAAPSPTDTLFVLRGLRLRMEQHHECTILDEALTAIVQLAARYVPERQFPDKGIDLLDEACAMVGIEAVKGENHDALRALAYKLRILESTLSSLQLENQRQRNPRLKKDEEIAALESELAAMREQRRLLETGSAASDDSLKRRLRDTEIALAYYDQLIETALQPRSATSASGDDDDSVLEGAAPWSLKGRLGRKRALRIAHYKAHVLRQELAELNAKIRQAAALKKPAKQLKSECKRKSVQRALQRALLKTLTQKAREEHEANRALRAERTRGKSAQQHVEAWAAALACLQGLGSERADQNALRAQQRALKDALEVQETLKRTVCKEAVARVVSKWMGVPVTKLQAQDRLELANLESRLAQRVVGQERAVRSVADAIRRSRLGLTSNARPIGSFLFAGLSGTGKTLLGRTIAAELFHSESHFVRLDMSEFTQDFAVNRLIGSPPGYAQSEFGGQLTNAVRKHPYCAVLVDELEKAHPRVVHLFLQVLDAGRLTDGRGELVDFSNTVMIFTSNVGAAHLAHVRGEVPDAARQAVLAAVRAAFPTELVNRFDDVVVFNALTSENYAQIFELKMGCINARLAEQRVRLCWSAGLQELLLRGVQCAAAIRPGEDDKRGRKQEQEQEQEQVSETFRKSGSGVPMNARLLEIYIDRTVVDALGRFLVSEEQRREEALADGTKRGRWRVIDMEWCIRTRGPVFRPRVDAEEL